MRTGVRHDAAPEIVHQILKFLSRQRIIRFHRVTANRLGNNGLAQPQAVDLLSRSLQFIHQLERKPARVGHLDERRQGVQQKRALAKFAQTHAQPRQCGQLLPQKKRVARGQLHRLRQQQSL